MKLKLVQRRRSRINEKMKALQTLIPNSSKVALLSFHIAWFLRYGFVLRFPWNLGANLSCICCFWRMASQVQTDKASMLDDAIEYLKQLQLQVQVTKLTPPCLFASTNYLQLGYAGLPGSNQQI
jgi:hypothetical protein